MGKILNGLNFPFRKSYVDNNCSNLSKRVRMVYVCTLCVFYCTATARNDLDDREKSADENISMFTIFII